MVRRAFPGSTEVTLFVFLYIFSEKLTKDLSVSVDMYQPISLCLLSVGRTDCQEMGATALSD